MRVSSYIPPLCSFSSAPLRNQISAASLWRTVIFSHVFETWSTVVEMIQHWSCSSENQRMTSKYLKNRNHNADLTLTYAQMIVLRLSLARQQIKDELQHLENKPDFSYKILQQLLVRMSAFLNQIFLIHIIFSSSGFSFLLLHCLFFL